MTITYMCDRCGETVASKKHLSHRKLSKSGVEANEDESLGVFWEGDLCRACQNVLGVMQSRAMGEAAWEFIVCKTDGWTGTHGLFEDEEL